MLLVSVPLVLKERLLLIFDIHLQEESSSFNELVFIVHCGILDDLTVFTELIELLLVLCIFRRLIECFVVPIMISLFLVVNEFSFSLRVTILFCCCPEGQTILVVLVVFSQSEWIAKIAIRLLGSLVTKFKLQK